jgi:hypothetical protein
MIASIDGYLTKNGMGQVRTSPLKAGEESYAPLTHSAKALVF